MQIHGYHIREFVPEVGYISTYVQSIPTSLVPVHLTIEIDE